MEVTKTISYITRVIVTLCCVLFLLVSYGGEGKEQAESRTVGLPIGKK